MTVDRLFLDANVLFSAAYRPDAGIARLWKLKNVELLTSHYAAEEARINLIDREQQQRLAELLVVVRIVTGISPLPREVSLPEKDRPILQAALHASATHLLTGDKQHFGQYFGRSLGGVLVLPPAEYFQRHRH
ncbi:MAG: PIN domain-containing protein [Terriglobales bacterium]